MTYHQGGNIMYKVEFENEKVEKLVKKEHIENVIDCYYEDIEDANISDIVEIFVADYDNEVRYFFYDKKSDLVYETFDNKSDLQ